MKFFKTVVVALIITFALTGCYTQLQYSQKMKRVSDQESVDEYSWNDDEKAYPSEGDYDEYEEGYVPIYYKDYDAAGYWNDCRCSPYSYRTGYVDGFYGGRSYGSPFISLGFGFGYGSRFDSHTWYHNPSWYMSSRFWFNYYYGPASPFRFYAFFDPFFYDSFFFYNPYYFGYGPYYAGYYGYGGYYGGGYGYGYVRDYEPARRYGLRSRDGASRVDTDRSTRTRGAARIDSGTRARSSDKAVRSRSTSSTRSRGTVERSRSRSGSTGRVTPTRTRNSSGSSGSVGRSRSSGSSRSSGTRSRGNDSINESRLSPVGFIDTRGNIVRSPAVRLGSSDIESNRLRNARHRNVQRSSSHSFWDRLKSAFDSDRSHRTFIRNRRHDSPSVRSHFERSSSRPAVRSRSSGSNRSSGSTVTKSRSRSSSSGTRSRSSGSSRSRSRGNN